jgi:long-subunit acyl-CoA synthetase (AMP-forming)
LQIWDLIGDFGAGIDGLAENLKLDPGERIFVGITGHNSIQWLVSDYAMLLRPFVVVPLPAITLIPSQDEPSPVALEAITHILGETKPRIIICEDVKARTILAAAKACDSVQYLVYWPSKSPGVVCISQIFFLQGRETKSRGGRAFG